MTRSARDETPPGRLWQQNLTFLEHHAPRLHAALTRDAKALEDSLKWEVGSASGKHVLIRDKEKFRSLHSKIDPAREAKRFLDHAGLNPLQNLILFGLGLGHHLHALLEHPGRPPWILVVEGDLRVLRAYGEVAEYRTLYETPGFHFLPCPSEQELFYFLQPESFTILANGLKILRHQASTSLNPGYYAGLDRKVQDFLKWANINVSTQVRVAGTFSLNTFANLPAMARSASLAAFRDCFQGLPAIVIAAGPSLARNGYLLRRAKGKAVLIAVDTALSVLSYWGVVPEFVVSTDFTQNAQHYFFEEQDREFSTVLLTDPEVYPAIPRRYRGPVVFYEIERKSLCQWLSRVLGDFGCLPKGLSVSHTAFSAAVSMGVSHVIFVGQDLAYTGGRTHVRGASHGVDMHAGAHSVLVPGRFGPVRTSTSLKVFLDHYEEMISRMQVPVWDATEGGAWMQGTRWVTLREVVMDLPQPEKSPAARVAEILKVARQPRDPAAIAAHLEAGRAELETLIARSRELKQRVQDLLFQIEKKNINWLTFEKRFVAYQKTLSRLSFSEKAMDLIRDNMVDAYVIRAKRFRPEGEGSRREVERETVVPLLSHHLAYYQALEKAAVLVHDQMGQGLQYLSAPESLSPKGEVLHAG